MIISISSNILISANADSTGEVMRYPTPARPSQVVRIGARGVEGESPRVLGPAAMAIDPIVGVEAVASLAPPTRHSVLALADAAGVVPGMALLAANGSRHETTTKRPFDEAKSAVAVAARRGIDGGAAMACRANATTGPTFG